MTDVRVDLGKDKCDVVAEANLAATDGLHGGGAALVVVWNMIIHNTTFLKVGLTRVRIPIRF
jgi:hypothetical protein